MYNIKIYDRKNTFKTTLSENTISCNFTFSATVWSGLSSLKFEYYGNFNIQHRDRIKIFKEWKIIYQWYVTWIQKISDKSWEKEIITLNWLLWLLAYQPRPDWTYTSNPWTLIKNNFETIGDFNTDKIQQYPTIISLQSSWNTALSFLQEILKTTSNYWFFLTANNEVFFWPYEKEHHLTYWKEVFWIEITEDSSAYYNKFRINYSWWTRIEENQNEIETYWESYQIITDSTIKNLTTAQARINSLFQENWIKNTIKIKVNKDYDYFSILPWEILSIRNTKTIIENKPIKQIHYSKDSATILLESYTALENFI